MMALRRFAFGVLSTSKYQRSVSLPKAVSRDIMLRIGVFQCCFFQRSLSMSAVRSTTFYNSSIEAVKDVEDDSTIMFGGDGFRSKHFFF